MSAIMVCSEDSSEKERGWTIIATKILCLSLIGVIHFQGRFWDIKLQMNCLTLSWIRSMHLNFQKVCNFLLQFRILFCRIIFIWLNPSGIFQSITNGNGRKAFLNQLQSSELTTQLHSAI